MRAGRLLTWYYDHRDQVDQYAGHAAGDEGDEEKQPEPESADTEKLRQTAAYSCDNAIASGTP